MGIKMKIGNREFETDKHAYIMGILNITPDSFSDGGKWTDKDRMLYHVEQMIQEGMDIVDVGGESTRPGHIQISEEEEIARVAPMIELIKSRFNIPISLDTYKASVAEAGIKAGADLINDIWGLKYDDKIAGVISDYNVPCCLMHNRSCTVYENLVGDVCTELLESVKRAETAGIPKEQVILDPGIGFGKTCEQNLIVLNHLDAIRQLGYPVLLGTSRKSVIGLTLKLPVEERLEGTIATTVLGVMKGCSFIRVHDVKENVRALRMTEAILKSGIYMHEENE